MIGSLRWNGEGIERDVSGTGRHGVASRVPAVEDAAEPSETRDEESR